MGSLFLSLLPYNLYTVSVKWNLLVAAIRLNGWYLELGIWNLELCSKTDSTIRAHKPLSVIIMNLDVDPNSITASDYALICTHWKVPDPSKAGTQLMTYRCPKEVCISIATKRFTKCDNNNFDRRFILLTRELGLQTLSNTCRSVLGLCLV